MPTMYFLFKDRSKFTQIHDSWSRRRTISSQMKNADGNMETEVCMHKFVYH